MVLGGAEIMTMITPEEFRLHNLQGYIPAVLAEASGLPVELIGAMQREAIFLDTYENPADRAMTGLSPETIYSQFLTYVAPVYAQYGVEPSPAMSAILNLGEAAAAKFEAYSVGRAMGLEGPALESFTESVYSMVAENGLSKSQALETARPGGIQYATIMPYKLGPDEVAEALADAEALVKLGPVPIETPFVPLPSAVTPLPNPLAYFEHLIDMPVENISMMPVEDITIMPFPYYPEGEPALQPSIAPVSKIPWLLIGIGAVAVLLLRR
jgi:hypothetical protein